MEAFKNSTEAREVHRAMRQAEFDSEYITSCTICEKLYITRMAVSSAISRKYLPLPITTNSNGVSIWKIEDVMDIIDEWAEKLAKRRGHR